ncbi:RTA1 like protein-domain-containing protein [Nemania sp. FL0916]|nr:RTA1 like protein-domain-containing protein [Nemania sp. FL0916]
MADGQYVEGSIWFYAPNKGAAIFFTIAFAVTGLLHFWQAIHYHSWRLTGLYVFSSSLFIGGFIARILGAFDYKNIIKYIVSLVLTYAAPPLYELGNYYMLGRVLYFVPYCSPIHPGRVLTTFAAISSIVEVLNGIGASYVANRTRPESIQEVGRSLLKAALLLQLAVAAAFIALATLFLQRCRKHGINNTKVNQPLLTLYISTSIIVVRTIYRTVEYFEISSVNFYQPGFDPSSQSPILREEWFFYVFEAALMLINSVLINVRHPRRWLPQTTKLYLAKDGVTEIMGPGYKEERNFVATLVDPFDIYGMIKGKDKATAFWNQEPGTHAGHKAEATPSPLSEPQQV